MWPEVETAACENRHELILSGAEISERLNYSDSLDPALFRLTALNLLRISDTCLNILPDEIAQLVNLQSLLLHSNKLVEISPRIGDLAKLKLLDLSRNQLTDVPSEITKLTALTSLNLSLNNLKTLPSIQTNSKLSVLDVSNNQLEQFPDICHSELVHLLEVKLNCNKITNIPGEINQLSALKVFDLSSNCINIIPGELAEAPKLKELNLKLNPVADKRLLKLIDQCRSKQVLDYVKAHCPTKGRTDNAKAGGGKKGNKKSDKREQKKSESTAEQNSTELSPDEGPITHKVILARTTDEDKPPDVHITENVKNVRAHILCCTITNVTFDDQKFRKFIQMQTKLHDGICEKRNAATIATHDLAKLSPGDLTYTACAPAELLIRPLARGGTLYSGAKLFEQLRAEAESLRREKKRNAYSGVHRYLYLLEGKPLYPCLLDSDKRVVSFPPITNSDDTKISLGTKSIFVEVTSASSQDTCRKILDCVIRETLLLGLGKPAEDAIHHTLTVQRVKIIDPEGNMKAVYPSRADLNYAADVKVVRE